jgi:hypothetical protein
LESLIFIIIFVLTTIPLFILGLFIKKGKGLMLIAGYNTLSKEERDKVNKEELSRTVGNLLIRMAIEILLLGVAINYRLKWAIVILILLIITDTSISVIKLNRNNPIKSSSKAGSKASAAITIITLIGVGIMFFYGEKAPDIDWLNAGFSIELPGMRKLVSKVCGILTSDATSNGEDRTSNLQNIDSSQQPNAYISLSIAKNLLQRSGQSAEYMAAYVRVTNIGQAEKISREVASLGLFASNSSEELQTRWDSLTREMYYLIIMAVFFLLGSITLMSAWRKLSLMEERQSWNMLLWMGLMQRNIKQIFSLQGFMISIAGWAIGSIIAKALPSFLSPENLILSTFALPIPSEAIIVSFLLCIFMGQLFLVCRLVC